MIYNTTITNTRIPINLHTYIHAYLHTYIPTYIHIKSYRSYKSYHTTLQTLPYPTDLHYQPYSTTLQTLPYTTRTDNPRMCHEKTTYQIYDHITERSLLKRGWVYLSPQNPATLGGCQSIKRETKSGGTAVAGGPVNRYP